MKQYIVAKIVAIKHFDKKHETQMLKNYKTVIQKYEYAIIFTMKITIKKICFKRI